MFSIRHFSKIKNNNKTKKGVNVTLYLIKVPKFEITGAYIHNQAITNRKMLLLDFLKIMNDSLKFNLNKLNIARKIIRIMNIFSKEQKKVIKSELLNKGKKISLTENIGKKNKSKILSMFIGLKFDSPPIKDFLKI